MIFGARTIVNDSSPVKEVNLQVELYNPASNKEGDPALTDLIAAIPQQYRMEAVNKLIVRRSSLIDEIDSLLEAARTVTRKVDQYTTIINELTK